MKSEKMLDVICEEIDKIAEKGLTTQNLETAYKLIDMYKDLKTVEGMDDYAEENYSQRGMSMRGRGRGARRDSMGRYSRAYDEGNSFDGERRYMDSKRMYRNEHSMASKQDMLDSLDEYMDSMHTKLKELKRDADTQEERDTIDRYIKMLERI